MRDFEVPQETTQRLADVQAPVLNVVMHVECYSRACTVNLENRAEETIPWSLGHTYRHSIRELHRQAHWGGEGQTGRRRRAQLPLTSAWRISSSHFTSRPALVPPGTQQSAVQGLNRVHHCSCCKAYLAPGPHLPDLGLQG